MSVQVPNVLFYAFMRAVLKLYEKHAAQIHIVGDQGKSWSVLPPNAVHVCNRGRYPVTLVARRRNAISESADLNKVLLDCNKQEEQIIIKAAEALKAVLFEFGV